jgi:nucleotide-binding universal stress UspA family protein
LAITQFYSQYTICRLAMKTILVLTDFSINADYAAHYALKLAQRINANLLLCNIYELPQGERIMDPNAWPLAACEENSIQDLGELSARLKAAIDKDKEGLFRPEINQFSHGGGVIDSINHIATKNKILLAVISSHNANWLSTLISGNHTHDIIEAADFPVMLIPYQQRFTAYKTIAFATSSNYTDINILESLTGLAKYTDAEILITQVVAEDADENEALTTLKRFFNQIPNKINYQKILYRILKNKQVIAGLIWVITYADIDLLVLVHRRRNSFQKMFEGSLTQKLAKFLHKPLLIFPCSKVKETLTVF